MFQDQRVSGYKNITMKNLFNIFRTIISEYKFTVNNLIIFSYILPKKIFIVLQLIHLYIYFQNPQNI